MTLNRIGIYLLLYSKDIEEIRAKVHRGLCAKVHRRLRTKVRCK